MIIFLTIGATLQNKSNFTAFHYLNQEKILQYGGGTLTDSIKTIEDQADKNPITHQHWIWYFLQQTE